jgi:hypothetical protein
MAAPTAAGRVDCPAGHGPMVVRAVGRQSPEQLWAGTWWDCAYEHGGPYGRCGSATLDPSPELTIHLDVQRRTAGS